MKTVTIAAGSLVGVALPTAGQPPQAEPAPPDVPVRSNVLTNQVRYLPGAVKSLVVEGLEENAPGVRMNVDSAIDFSDMLEANISLAADRPVTLSLSGSFNLPGKWWRQSGVWVGQTVFHYLFGLDVASSVDIKVQGKEKPIGYCLTDKEPA